MFVQTVALKDIKCYAFHGYYPEEQLVGNHFVVDVEVDFVPTGETEDLSNTVNYEVINEIVLNEMSKTQKLLETLVKTIISELINTYPFIISAKVGIKKLNPPMKGEVGYSFVQLNFTSSDR